MNVLNLHKPVEDGGDYEAIYKKLFGELKWTERKANEFPSRDKLLHPSYKDKFDFFVLRTKLTLALEVKTAMQKGLRATHTYGVGGKGFATIVSPSPLPENDLFLPDEVFQINIRHANSEFDDDAKADFRSISIKFLDQKNPDKSRFDLIMNSGKFCGFWNMPSFVKFGSTLGENKPATRDYIEFYPNGMAGAINGLRFCPESYHGIHFYSQVVYHFTDKNKKLWLVKFRTVPFNYNTTPETGLLTPEHQAHLWDKERPADFPKPKNYCRQEYKDTLAKGPIKYRLQVQVREAPDFLDPDLYHMGISWDLPYKDFAILEISNALKDEETETTKFWLGQLPNFMVLPPAPTGDDYRSIAMVRSSVYPRVQAIREALIKLPLLDTIKNPVTYQIKVETANNLGSGTDAKIIFELNGTRGSWKSELNKPYHNDFEKGSIDSFLIKQEDIGDLLYATITAKGLHAPGSDWRLKSITVNCMDYYKTWNFPVYRWEHEGETMILFEGKATLPQNDLNEKQIKIRTLELKNLSNVYIWNDISNAQPLPGHLNIDDYTKLPDDVHFFVKKMAKFKYDQITSQAIKDFTVKFKNEQWKSFDDVKEIFCKMQDGIPQTSNFWQSDIEYGRQQLNGIHPVWHHRVYKLPDNFPVTDQLLKGLLRPGTTLESEIAEGRIYLCDYSILEGIPIYISKKGEAERFLPICMSLFYVDEGDNFVPIAIQCGLDPKKYPIFTPNDTPEDWLLAKLNAKCSDSQVHQMISHLLLTHLCMEPFAVALYRGMNPRHPIYKLLHPHLQATIAINTIGRKVLIAPDGIADIVLSCGGGGHMELMSKAYKSLHWDRFNLLKNLTQRGVDDPVKLPGYYFRDDATLIWNAIHHFVAKIVRFYYRTDDDIKKDKELQVFLDEVRTKGLSYVTGIPQSLNTQSEITEFLTCIIFTCSVSHSAQNYGQYEQYSFAPNQPASILLPPPTERGKVTQTDLLKAIPDVELAASQIKSSFVLSQYSTDDVFLGDYPETLFTEGAPLTFIAEFQDELKEISEKIQKRNKNLIRPYSLCLPDKITNSIVI